MSAVRGTGGPDRRAPSDARDRSGRRGQGRVRSRRTRRGPRAIDAPDRGVVAVGARHRREHRLGRDVRRSVRHRRDQRMRAWDPVLDERTLHLERRGEVGVGERGAMDLDDDVAPVGERHPVHAAAAGFEEAIGRDPGAEMFAAPRVDGRSQGFGIVGSEHPRVPTADRPRPTRRAGLQSRRPASVRTRQPERRRAAVRPARGGTPKR